MKILEIAGKNLASFADTFCIQLDTPPFADVGLFAITGKTGSGKSTILDAMCIALYGQTPRFPAIRQQGLKMADDIYISDPRRILRQGCLNCYARVRFLTATDHIYEAMWSFSIKTKNPKAKRTLENLTTGEKLDIREIEQIIGLNFNQFCHSVLLAQGQFAAFLKMPSAERAALLEHMTDTHIYSQISKATFERFRKEEATLEQITSQLNQLTTSFELTDEAALRESVMQFEQSIKQAQEDLQLAQQAAHWYHEMSLLDNQLQVLVQTRTQTYIELETLQKQIETLSPEYLKQKEEIEKQKQTFHTEQEKIAQLKKEKKRYDENAKKLTVLNHDYLQNEKHLQEQKQRLSDTERSVQQYEQELNSLSAWFYDHQEIDLFFNNHPEFFALLNQCMDREQQRTLLEQDLTKVTQTLASYHTYHAIPTPSPDYYDSQIETCSILFDLDKQLHESEKALSALQDKKHILLQQIDALRQEHIAIQTKQHSLQIQLDTAKQFALSISQAEVIEKLRELLHPDTACPVCGSRTHPIFDTAPEISLAEKARQDAKIIQNLEQQYQQYAMSLHNIEGKLAILEKNKDELFLEQQEKQKTFTDKQTRWLNHTSCPWSADPTLQTNLIEKHTKLLQQKKEITAYCHLLDKKQECIEQIQMNTQRLTQCNQKIIVFLPPILKIEFEQTTRSTFTTRMRDFFTVWCERKQVRDTISKKLQNLVKQIQIYQENLTEFNRKIAHQEATRIQLLEIQKQLDLVFQRQLGSVELSIYEQKICDNFTLAHQVWTKIEQQYMLLLTQQQHHLGQKAQIDLQHDQMLMRQRQLTDTQPHLTQAEAQCTLQENQELLNTFHLTLGTLREQLAELQLKQNQIITLKQAQKQQAMIFGEWKKLNELIGSATGQKFQQFAQNLTFEYLLYHANQQLHMLTTRYTLKRLENTTNRLEMLIVDHYLGNEERSVHSLSGGETFLVSLALALGLASLSSQRVPIYSLFIDEGFGTLDNESLELVLNALERLHLHGKQIGIISHVPALSERIQTKINVLARHQGQSILHIEA